MKYRIQLIPTSDYFMELKEIARMEKISYQRVQQIIDNAIRKLREFINEGEF